jgi:type VI secretion system protein ImpJ
VIPLAAPARRVVWEEGMHLLPQHFQAQRRHAADQVARSMDLLTPFGWGVAALELDHEALASGMLVLRHLQLRFPDGTSASAPDIDLLPPPVTLADRFSPTQQAQVAWVVLPPWSANAANVAGLEDAEAEGAEGAAAPCRLQAVRQVVVDEATGGDPLEVRLAALALRVRLDHELGDGAVAVPVARIRRDGRGHFQADEEFVPPALHLGASPRLAALTRTLVSLLEHKESALAAAAQLAPPTAAGGAAAYRGNEVASRWLLHAVRSALPALRHLQGTPAAHPERLYLELARLAGALCTFALGVSPRDLPVYSHHDPTPAFDALETHLRAQLGTVVSARALVVPLERVNDLMQAALVPEPRAYEPGARWFLGVRAPVSHAALVERVPRLAKVSASAILARLVNDARDGLAIAHLPVPPAGLAPSPGLAYFELQMAGPNFLALGKTRELGVYTPAELQGAYIELAVLLPDASPR